jgi:sodium-dependent phosphate cotransporter
LIWNLLKVLVLVYFFLAAINMMGSGIKIMGKNPEYKPAKEAVKELGDEAFGTAVDPDARLVPSKLSAEDMVALNRRGVAGAVGTIDATGGFIAFKGSYVAAVLAPGLRTAAHDKQPVAIESVTDERVVIRPIHKHKDWLVSLFEYAHNPFLALLVGILVTATFQSSSFTTSFTVGLVATVNFPLASAVFVIMGANIGTSVTNTIVSMGYVNRREEFRKALAAGTVHDFFNLMTVVVMFVLELTTGFLSRSAAWLSSMVYHTGGDAQISKPKSFLKEAVKPVGEALHWFLRDVCNLPQDPTGIAITVIAVAVLFLSLMFLVRTLRGLVLTRVESFFDRVLFRNAGIAFLVGLILTAAVQSSSVTTSLIVPLTAAGLLTLRQVFPYMLGANIGTTFTAMLAAFATAAATEKQANAGLTLACAHLLFNVLGAVFFYPFRFIPIYLAQKLGDVAAVSKRYAVVWILFVFFGVPLLGIAVYAVVTGRLGG